MMGNGNSITCKDKENLLRQKSIVIWFTGLSGSGKTTLAGVLEHKLYNLNYLTRILDGDELRIGLNAGLGFSDSDRYENIRRVAEVAKMFVETGVITICCFISPTMAMRKMAQNIIGKEQFIEVYLNCPLEICERRDVKGLYVKARSGLINEFTGITSVYEPPEHADIEIHTDNNNIDQAVERILDHILPLITNK